MLNKFVVDQALRQKDDNTKDQKVPRVVKDMNYRRAFPRSWRARSTKEFVAEFRQNRRHIRGA